MSLSDPCALFPHPVLTKPTSGRQPTHEEIDTILQEIYANAISVPSFLDEDNKTCLYVVTTQAQYQAMMETEEDYTEPPHPGPSPVYQVGATNAQITAANQEYAMKEKAYTMRMAVEARTKKQIIDAFDSDYLVAKKHRLLGYTNVTARDLIQHLIKEYGSYTRDALTANEAKFTKEWNPAVETIEKYYECIQHYE